MTQSRYAIYFVPPDNSPLYQWASKVLGYNSRTGLEDTGFTLPGIGQDQWFNWTSAPRQYGFHATLVAPFELQIGHTEAELIDRLLLFASNHRPVIIRKMVLRNLGEFLALCPFAEQTDLQDLASNLVRELNSVRAPLSDYDFKRRLKPNLTEQQILYLKKYGYPYVHEEFRFHMTLTGSLPDNEIESVKRGLKETFPDVENIVTPVTTLCLMQQLRRDDRFRVIEEVRLLEEFTGLGAWR